MNYDWNSFFGTFAQVAGAFIGIIAAFLISRILGLKERLSVLLDDFDKLLNQQFTLQAALEKRSFKFVNENTIIYSSKLAEAIRKGSFRGLKDSERVKLARSIESLYDDSDGILECLKKLEKRVTIGPTHIFVSHDILKQVQEEREKITNLEVQVYSLNDLVAANKSSLALFQLNNIKPLKWIAIVILITFPMFVVYPLHFLPIKLNSAPTITININAILDFYLSLKGIFITLFLIIIEGMFIYLYSLIIDLHREAEQIISYHFSGRFLMKSYSQYLDEKKSFIDEIFENRDKPKPIFKH